MFLMWGYEGEELSDIEATVDHVKRCRPGRILHYRLLSHQRNALLRPGKFKDCSYSGVAGIDRSRGCDSGRHSRRFYNCADELLRAEMAADPSAMQINAARCALESAATEVEA